MIIAKNLTKKYANDTILENLEFILGNNKKIGLVGRNGSGKSTLIKLLADIEEVTGGAIIKEAEKIGYIPQEFAFPNELTGEYLEKKLENSWDFYKIENLVEKVKFKNFDIYQPIHTLSEGQKMKLKIIEIMLLEPTTLLIDEPTNHLDIDGIMWFEDYVKNLPVTVLMISHDREFLNHTVDEIWEIENHKIIKFVGNYDSYKEEKLKLVNKWNEEYAQFIKKKAKLEALLERARKGIASAKTGKAIRAAKKRIEREVVNNSKEQYIVKKLKNLNFDSSIHSKKLMVKFENVSKSYNNIKVFENISFELRGKEKLWLYGPNGAGKSTIVKIIMGEEKIDRGTIKIGENISIGYYSQVQKDLNFDQKLIDYFSEQTQINYFDSFRVLERFLFTKERAQKRIWQLSPGERSRFKLAVFASKKYDLIIMDEPDNHLDIETKEALEKSLHDFEGTLLLISHDRYFVESVGVNKVLNLRNGCLSLF